MTSKRWATYDLDGMLSKCEVDEVFKHLADTLDDEIDSLFDREYYQGRSA